MDMNKTNSSIDENEESLVGEVLSDDEVREKSKRLRNGSTPLSALALTLPKVMT